MCFVFLFSFQYQQIDDESTYYGKNEYAGENISAVAKIVGSIDELGKIRPGPVSDGRGDAVHFPDFRGDIGLEKSDCLVFGEIRYAGKRE